MTGRAGLCDRVQQRASLYLDGRLQAPVRRRIQEHLRACPPCISEYRAMRRLSRLCGELPGERAPRGLARRVRRSLAERRRATLSHLRRGGVSVSLRGWRVAAAGALLVLLPAVGAIVGYGAGWRAAAETVADAPSPKPEPAPAPRPAPVDPALFDRAAHAVLSDLAVLEEVPEPLRRPLVETQLIYFDLVTRADEVLELAGPSPHRVSPRLQALASFVHELGQSLDGTGEPFDPAELRGALRERRLLEPPTATTAAFADHTGTAATDRIRGVVQEVASSLQRGDRAALAALLQRRHAWVRDDRAPLPDVVDELGRTSSETRSWWFESFESYESVESSGGEMNVHVRVQSSERRR